MPTIHRIPTTHVELGMFVSETTPGLKDTGLNSRGLITKNGTLEKLKGSSISEIHIDVSKGKSSAYSIPVASRRQDLDPTTPFEEERKRAESVYSEARSLVGSLITDVKMGKAIDVGPIEGIADEISESVLSNSNALLCLSQIREKDQYLLEHSINVGILMGVFSRFLGYSSDELHQLVTGAILHDIGKIRVPNHVLHKVGKLNDKEWEQMRNHVLYGEEVLIKSPGISDIAIKICAQHHEKLNGAGYPRGLKGEEVSVYGRLASIVDIYDAITADRVYHKGQSPNETMRILTKLGQEDLDKALVYQFIRCMSVYPVGTLLELSNHTLGVVTQIYPDKPDSPRVKVFFDSRERRFVTPHTVDLSDSKKDLRVVKVHDPDALNIKVKEYI